MCGELPSNLVHDLLGELIESKMQEVVIKFNNTSTIGLVKNILFEGRSKHIKSRYHYIRKRVEEKEIMVEHISGKQQRADILTKALTKIKFVEMRKLLGVEDLSISIRKLGGEC